MIRRSRSTKYPATPGNPGSDTDALHTDVMRFMSIIGLCLMAVFALVQSIPLRETDPSGRGPELEKLHQDITLQQEQARVLQADLNVLTTQIRSTQEEKTSTQRALLSAQEHLTQVIEQTQQARSDRDYLTVELEALRRQVAQGRDELAGIQQVAQKQAHSLREPQPQLDEEKKKHTPAADSSAIDKRPPATPEKSKQGFTLRFASAEALDRLVAAGTVSLYGMASKQAWRLSLGNGQPVFAQDTFPGWFHEMAPSTVPTAYVQTLEKSLGLLAQSSVVWGVQLPSATRQGIASLTRGLQGGTLVIGADGKVTLEPE